MQDRRAKPKGQPQAGKSPFLSRLLSNPLYADSSTEKKDYSPGSNPFGQRPTTRTPTGTAIIASGDASSRLTTSADGAYYDLELTPGVTSKPGRASTELASAASERGADTWLSSPEVELEGLQASWDSVQRQEEKALPAANWGSLHDMASKLSSLGTPRGDSSKARSWLREHAKTPLHASRASTDDPSWKIPAGSPTIHQSASAGNAAQSPAGSEGVGATPRPAASTASPLSPLSVPSPAYEYPRSFPVLEDISNLAAGLPSATGSLKSWLKEEGSQGSLSPSKSGETVAAVAEAEAATAPAAAKEGSQPIEAAAALVVSSLGAFASPISMADSPRVPLASARTDPAAEAAPVQESRPAAAAPAPRARRQRSDVPAMLACLLVALWVAAAPLLVLPAGSSFMMPAGRAAGTSPAIFPQGGALPQLPTELPSWVPAWLQPATLTQAPAPAAKAGSRAFTWGPAWLNPAAPAPATSPAPAAPAPVKASSSSSEKPAPAGPVAASSDGEKAAPAPARRSPARFFRPILPNPPLPLSWSKPAPSQAQVLGTSQFSKQAPPAPASAPQPAAAPQPEPRPLAKPAGSAAKKLGDAPTRPAAQPVTPAPVFAPAATQPALVAEARKPTAAAAAQQSALTAAATLQQLLRQAQGSELMQQALAALAALPTPAGSPAAWAAATAAAAVLGGLVALLGGGSTVGAAADGGELGTEGEEDLQEEAVEEEAGPRVAEGGRPGIKTHLFSHMKLQKAPTTTPAVGGRARRRQSNVAVIEDQLDNDGGLPSVAPRKPATRTTAAPTPRTATRVTRRAAAAGAAEEGEISATPATVRRSRRLAL